MSSDLLLQKLKEINGKSIDVYIPSLDKEVPFKPLNIRQQKEIIKASFDKNIPGISFNNILNIIIKENCQEQNIELLVTDRPSIAIALRKNIFGTKIKNAVKSDTLNEESIEFDLEQVIQTKSKLDIKLTKTVKSEGLEVQLRIPTLTADSRVNKESQKVLSHLVEQNNTIKDLISELFVYELVKFIDFVEVLDVGKAVFSEISVVDQIKLVESLTAEVNKNIMEYIEEVRAFEKKYLSFTQNNKEYNINLDASFFSNE